MSPGCDEPRLRPEVGLCSVCLHARVQEGRAGARYWRCARAEHDAGFLRYPPLPVQRCAGFEPVHPARRPASDRC